jgi:hypothetical protein
VSQVVLPQNTNVCSAVSLQNAQAACANGHDSVQCTQFFAFLAAVEPQCGSCLGNFRSAFFDPNFPTFGKGISACVAPFVTPECRRSLGCSQDCLDTSCTALHALQPAVVRVQLRRVALGGRRALLRALKAEVASHGARRSGWPLNKV